MVTSPSSNSSGTFNWVEKARKLEFHFDKIALFYGALSFPLTFLLSGLCAAVRMNSVTMVANSGKEEAKPFDWPPFQFAKENFIYWE